MRPIDADEVFRLRDEQCDNCESLEPCFDCIIKRTPTLDYAPIIHAHFTEKNWYGGTMHECSNCKYLNIFAGAYCADCGAKMDEKEDGQNA